MKKALNYILQALVSAPDKIKVVEEEENGLINFRVTVDKDDMGKVIGKNGKVIRAIRNVLKIPAIKANKKINISLEEISS